MNVLHLVGGNLSGGAGLGAYLLHRGLLDRGVESNILTTSRTTFGDSNVHSVSNTLTGWIFEQLRVKIDQLPVKMSGRKEGAFFSSGIAGYNFLRSHLFKKADILNLHWINGGFINTAYLQDVNIPIVWTLRDMWPITGGCHYSMGCEKFKTKCYDCPQLGGGIFDLANIIYNRKRKHFKKNIHFVGISPWISKLAEQSGITKGKKIRTIFNNINCDEFFPEEAEHAKKELGIQTRKKIILVGAQDPTHYYKGFSEYLDSLDFLKDEKYYLAFFGNLNQSILENISFEYKNFGYLGDLRLLRLLYSAADVFVAPSKMEAFGKTLTESMACGTPVVCFNATGPKHIISHKKDGYKAKPFNPLDLAKGVQWITEEADYDKLIHNARLKAVKLFDISVSSKKYQSLYKELM